jgi:hypothetical protein
MVGVAHTHLAILALAFSCALGALAKASERISVYRCATVDGAISLQDHPCPASSAQTLRLLVRPPPSPPGSPLDSAAAATDSGTDEPHQTPDRQREPSPAPPLWVCLDYDGTERESSDGVARGRYVPLWVVGRDPDAPAQVFGRVGAPPPQPNVQPPGGPRTVYSSAGSAAQVYVEERCYLLTPGEACERYAERRRKLERRIFNSQPSERDRLRPESESLRRVLTDACQR